MNKSATIKTQVLAMRRAVVVASFIAGITVLGSASPLRAADIFWSNPLGGVFSDSANWVGGKAPNTSDVAIFNSDSTFEVTFAANATTSGLLLNTDNVTLQLNGHAFSAADAMHAALVGREIDDVAKLSLLNGSLVAGNVRVGQPSGAQGTLMIGKAASLELTSGAPRLDVFKGELRIIDGGVVVADPDAQIYVGSNALSFAPASFGALVVEGAGSSATADEIILRLGSVVVQAGGAISAETILVRRYELDFDSSAIVTGLTSKMEASATLNVNGATLTIQDRANVDTLDLRIGSGLDEVQFTGGTVTVSNSARLVVNDDFHIGGILIPGDGTVIPGRGTLKVTDAGEFVSKSSAIANSADTNGLVVVDGIGSSWTNSADFKVGDRGHGELVVSGGAHVTSGTSADSISSIGNAIGAQGELLLTDVGSRWESNGPLYVGFLGNGSVKIQSGATLASSTSAIAFLSGSSGHVEVTGAGSAWTVSDALGVGGHPFIAGGAGGLEISAGGLVSVATTATVWQTGAIQLDAGTLQATTINLSGGSLGGVGNVLGNLTNAGLVEPGSSPGTLNVQGDYTQSSVGLLNLEIGPAAFDLLQVSGNAKLGGTLHLSLLPGASPLAGTTYDLVTANKLTGTFNVLDLPNLGGDRSWTVTYGADRFSLTVVPEPASGLLAAIGLAIVLGMRRRR